jgi:hypothetical protein
MLWCINHEGVLSYFTDPVTFHVGKVGIFSCKRSQRCAYSSRAFKAGKEAGEMINITDRTSSMLRYCL